MIGDQLVQQAVEQALGSNLIISERPPLDFQSNQLFDVWQNGRHYIAKRYLQPKEWDVAHRWLVALTRTRAVNGRRASYISQLPDAI